MKRSKKPLTFAAIAAGIGALSLAVEGCVYAPPPEVDVYGPPPETEATVEITEEESLPTKKDADDGKDNPEVGVYGPPPDIMESIDGPEVDVYGPAPDEAGD